MTIRSAYYAFIGCTLFSLAISIRDGINFELVPVDIDIIEENRTVTGTMCTTTSDQKYRLSVLMFYALDTFLVFTCWTTIIVTYSRIALTLFRLKKKAKERNQNTRNTRQRIIPRDFDSNTGDVTTEINLDDNLKNVSITNIDNLNQTDAGRPTKNAKIAKQKKPRNPAESASERLMTLMMLTVSVGFIICILPYFAVRVTRLLLKLGADHELLIGNQFALRLTYVNSVFNPIVYCCFNPRFRQYFKDKLYVFFNRRLVH
ncbi:7 transmembrane receptor (rhodopsin) [Mactra antiquata]